MGIFIVSFTVFLISARSMLMKAASDRESGLPQIMIIFCTAALSSAVVSFVRGISLHRSTLIIALMFGVGNFLSQYLNIRAMGIGTASRVAFIVSCSFLLSTFYSIIVFRDPVSVFKAAGIILICAAQVVFCFGRDDMGQGETDSRKWMLYALAAMTFSGIVGIIQKYMQLSDHPNELPEMSMIAASTSSCISVLLLSLKREWKSFSRFRLRKKTLVFSIILGFVATVINIVSTYAHHFVDASLAFPVFNGGSLILSILAARLIFGDRLTRREILSVLTGILAIAIIGL